jgi:hypothetical protein
MMEMLNLATLIVVTLLAAAAAVALDWMLLRVMFMLMRPATAQQALRAPVRLASGTVRLARAYASQRGV